MTWGAVAAVGGGLLAAGGSVGGGLLSQSGGGQSVSTMTPPPRDPFSDPVTAGAAFDTLLNLGIVDPTILASASPITRAIQGVQRTRVGINDNQFAQMMTPLILQAAQETGETDPTQLAYQIRAKFMAGGAPGFAPGLGGVDLFKTTTGFIERIGDLVGALQASSGMSLSDLVAAEQNYQTNTTKRLSNLQGLADETLAGRVAAARARSQMLQGLEGNMAGIRGQELTRISDQYDKAQDQLLRQSNVAGYNPGRALGELSKSRVIDADLEALNRAIALVTGQGNLLNTLSGQPVDQSTQLGSVRTGGGAAQPGAVSTSPGNEGLASGIAQAIPAGLLSYNIVNQSRGPAGNLRNFTPQGDALQQQFNNLLAGFRIP